VGQTTNIKRRLKEHQSGKVFSTKKLLPIVLIHRESFNTRGEAMKKEKFFKSLYSTNLKKKFVKEFLSTARQNYEYNFE